MIKNVKILVVILIIVMLFSLFAYIQIKKDSNNRDGITALEGKSIADEVALNWSKNGTLIYVTNGGTIHDGLCNAWDYVYIESPSMPLIANESNCIGIRVLENKSYVLGPGGIGNHKPINSWIIDSDKAIELALLNEDIKSFMTHHPSMYSFFLSNASGTPNWFIEWTYDAGFDNPKWAQIKIDANTGAVLYVDVDD